MFTILTWMFASVAISLFIFCAALNAWLVFQNAILKRDTMSSIIPFIGGAAGSLGFSICPTPNLLPFSLVPLFMDVGCIPYFIGSVPYLAREVWPVTRFNMLREYGARSDETGRTLRLRLCKNDAFVMTQWFDPDPGQLKGIDISLTGKWTEAGEKLVLDTKFGQIIMVPAGTTEHPTLRQESGLADYEESPDTSLQDIAFVKLRG